MTGTDRCERSLLEQNHGTEPEFGQEVGGADAQNTPPITTASAELFMDEILDIQAGNDVSALFGPGEYSDRGYHRPVQKNRTVSQSGSFHPSSGWPVWLREAQNIEQPTVTNASATWPNGRSPTVRSSPTG